VVLTDDAARATKSVFTSCGTTFTRFEPAADLMRARGPERHHPPFEAVAIDARLKPWHPEVLFWIPTPPPPSRGAGSEYFQWRRRDGIRDLD
jgi:hypothetical protein